MKNRSLLALFPLLLLLPGCVFTIGEAKNTQRKSLLTDAEVGAQAASNNTLSYNWTAAEVTSRASQIEADATAALAGKQKPYSSRDLAWKNAERLAGEAKTALPNLTVACARLAKAADERSIATGPNDIEYPRTLRFHAGAATVRPYNFVNETVNGNATRRLTSSAETSFYAEADFLHRTAWIEPKNIDPSLGGRGYDRLLPQDYEVRIGFLNQERINEEGTAEDPFANASATVGGDWYAEGSLGWVLGMHNIDMGSRTRNLDRVRGTWGVELNGGFQTDRDGLNSTSYAQLGLGTTWAIPISIGDKKKMATLTAGVYVGVHEFPRVDIDNRIYSNAASIPFNQLGALGVKIDLTVPVTNAVDVVLQGRHYSALNRNDVVDDWTLFAGVSIPLGNLVRDLL